MIRLFAAVLLAAWPARAGQAAKPFATGSFDLAPALALQTPVRKFSQWAITDQAKALGADPRYLTLYASSAVLRPEAAGLLTPLVRRLPADPAFRAKLARVASLPAQEQREVLQAFAGAVEGAREEVARAAARELEPELSSQDDLGGLDGIRARRGRVSALARAASDLEGIYGGAELTELRKRIWAKDDSLQKALVAALVAHGARDWNTSGLSDVPAEYAAAGRAQPSEYFARLERDYRELSDYVERARARLLAIPGVRSVKPLANFLGNAAEPDLIIVVGADADAIEDLDRMERLMDAVDRVPGMDRRKWEFASHREPEAPRPIGELSLPVAPASDGRVSFDDDVEQAHRAPFIAAFQRQVDRFEETFGELVSSELRVRVDGSWRDGAGVLRYVGEVTVNRRKPIPVLYELGADGRLIVERRPTERLN